ncbi:MAG: Zn-ribbon domain-containing OB-fold protein [Acidimicrobiales bacterium]
MTRFFPDQMPVPALSSETAPWWEACAAHRLTVQQCDECGRTRHPPGPVCPSCRSSAAHFEELNGQATLYSYTVVRQAFLAGLEVPYVVAVVEPVGGGGIRMVSNVVGIDPEDVEIGMALQVVWEDMGPELALPRFTALGKA